MADRYWVGGSGLQFWDNLAGFKWSTTSGGPGGASVPTTSDNVFFDANSGSGICSISAGNSGCRVLNCTGYTGQITGSAPITVNGSLILCNNWIYGGTITLTSSGGLIDTVNQTLGNVVISSGASYILYSNLNAYTLSVYGDFNASTYNVTLYNFISSASSARILSLGYGVWTITGSGNVWDCSNSTNLTIYGQGVGTVIRFTTAGPSSKEFYGGGKPYPILENAGTGDLAIYGNNSFDELRNTISPAVFRFQWGSTQTIYGDLNLNGTSGNVVFMLSTSTGNKYYLSKSSGVESVNLCSIRDCGASGGATWNAINSTDLGNNTGWNFISNGNMLALFM